ncbi:VTT domain-containing protein [Streptomyces sp. TRM 70351]|uniref:TVP38/TMEM64 family protein n=1 Tax=Streptomyces sp. TRM 70351 TaxID=3116552 RepID=UPI002E7AFF60|nr:VTT domain-containing protein [Streptomyces sp. TRM 70351]MEE1930707.1 VTT domain-containing protein [Streptomyces sp. TRM 70351]
MPAPPPSALPVRPSSAPAAPVAPARPAAPAVRRSVLAAARPWLRLGLLLALVAAGSAAAVVYEPQRLFTGPWADGLPTVVAATAFAAAYGVCTSAFVPRPVLTLAAGLLFGAAAGTAAALAGTVLGAALSFGLGRLLGREALRPLLRNRRLAAADRLLSRDGFRAVLVLRLLPGVPFAASNYAASVSRMRWPAIVTGTAVGGLPHTAAYAVAGSRAADPTSPAFLAASAFLAVTGVGTVALAWRRRHRLRAPAPPVPAAAVG